MHFSNYISRAQAEACVERGVSRITLTPTAARQTPAETLAFLSESGVEVEVVASRGRPRKLDDARVRKILAMRKAGMSFYRIAGMTGIPKSTVFDYFRRYAGVVLSEEEVEKVELGEAKRVLERIAENLDGEAGRLAALALEAESRAELEYYLQELLLYINGE